jgi:4-hydroxybenzoate polyprenyltransferase
MHRAAALPETPAPIPTRVARVARALRIVHPFPTLLNVAATAALATVAWRGAPPGGLLLRMLLVMLLAQCAIGVTNDCCDRALDAETKPWKPIVAGLVRPQTAALTATLLAMGACAVAATLGAAGFGLAVLGLACGIAYDVGLKRTPLSAVPYMIAIPTLPAWVWTVAGAWRAALWWLLPLGALVGVALHLANTLPDIDADASQGVRGLAHRLGARRSMLVGWISFGAALALTAVIAPFVHYELAWYLPAALVGVRCLAASIGGYVARRDAAALQIGFALLGVGSAVVSVGWLAALT